jgi:hypothetical protein
VDERPVRLERRAGLNGYHPQDEAFLSWFAHQQPSIGYHGLYTYLGTFGSPAPTC